MLVPKYLEEITEVTKKSNNKELLKIRCKCNHNYFIAYKFFDKYINVKQKFNEIIRIDNKLYYVKRNFFGKIKEKIECNESCFRKQRTVVKIKCEKCGLEYILFDNYKYGYDATINFKDNFDDFDTTKFKIVYNLPVEVYIKLYQDLSYEQFKDDFQNIDYETYLNSFSNIDIYGIDSKSKKIKICSEETA